MNDYTEIIASENEYHTAHGSKKGILPTSLKFYKEIARIVIHSNSWARKGIYNDYRWVYSSLDILHSTEKAGLVYDITGMDNLKKFDGPAVFISNHMSTLETLVLPCLINPIKPVVFVTKKELSNYPVFGTIINARFPIIVGRSNPREDLMKVMEDGSKKLQEGTSIIIFPQRTRSSNFDPSSFNSLGVKLAKRNNVPVVPISLVTDAWANGKYVKELGKIDTAKKVNFEFGEPITVKSNGIEEHQQVINFIIGNLKKWGREDCIVQG